MDNSAYDTAPGATSDIYATVQAEGAGLKFCRNNNEPVGNSFLPDIVAELQNNALVEAGTRCDTG